MCLILVCCMFIEATYQLSVIFRSTKPDLVPVSLFYLSTEVLPHDIFNNIQLCVTFSILTNSMPLKDRKFVSNFSFPVPLSTQCSIILDG